MKILWLISHLYYGAKLRKSDLRTRTTRIKENLFLIFFLIGSTLLFQCQSVSILEEPDVLREKGIALGDEKNRVVERMGPPSIQLNFRKGGHLVSVFQYGSHQIDYNPGYEYDDYSSPIHSKPGFRNRYRAEYCLVFIDDRLYSMEDFIRQKYWALPGEEPEIQQIMEETRKLLK